MAEPPSIVSSLLVEDGRCLVLLGRRARQPDQGKWIPPGGKVHADETIRAAGERELLEETGLSVEIGEVGDAGIFPFDWAGRGYLIVYSRARVVGGRLRPGDDIDALGFYSASELPKLPLGCTARAALRWNGWLP